MKWNPIKIQINDNRRFAEVAFLVDRDDFIHDIEIVRKKLEINKLLSREEARKSWQRKNDKNWVFSKLEQEVEKLLKKYKKDWRYFSVLKYAIICGHITDEDYGSEVFIPGQFLMYGRVANKSCWYALPVGPEYEHSAQYQRADSTVTLNTHEAAIVINPGTKISDVQECFKLFQERIDKVYPHWKQEDVISNIKRDRKWYWMKQEHGLSYDKAFRQNQIWERERIGFEGFKKAIQQYQRRLNREI